MKRCNKCNVRITKKNRSKNGKTPSGEQAYRAVCKPCYNDYIKEIHRSRGLTAEGTAKNLFKNIKGNSKRRDHGIPTITEEWVLEKINKGKCEITDLPFRFSSDTRDPYAPSLDRDNNDEGYNEDNVKIVLWSVNCLQNKWDLEELKPVIKALAKSYND